MVLLDEEYIYVRGDDTSTTYFFETGSLTSCLGTAWGPVQGVGMIGDKSSDMFGCVLIHEVPVQ